MNRAAALILALAAVAAGLGALLLLDSGGGGAEPASTEPEGDRLAPSASDPEPSAGPATLAEVDTPSSGASASVAGTLDRWRIIPMNVVGQTWSDATITATRDGSALESVGPAEFEDVAAGTWDVVVEVEGQPTWRRAVDLPAGRSEKTFAYVGEELRVSGRLVDATDSPVGPEFVYFIPRGMPLPASDAFRSIAGTQGGKSFTLGGITGVRTTASGRFRFTLPRAGAYRVAVGRPGDLRWIQADPDELTHGGPDQVDVVVPRSASLEVRFGGDLDDRPSTITAYIFDAALAQRIETQSAAGAGRADIQAEQARVSREQRRKTGGDTTAEKLENDNLPKPLGDANRRTFDRNMDLYGEEEGLEGAGDEPARAPLFEPGWRPVGTARFDDAGVALFDDLPPAEPLRFLVVRTRERITTPGTLVVVQEKHSVGRLTMGPKEPEGSNRMVRRDDAAISVRVPEEQAETPLEVGAHWSIADR